MPAFLILLDIGCLLHSEVLLEMALVFFAKHALIPPFQIVAILTVSTQTIFEGNAWVKGDLLVRISESTIAVDTVRVTT